MLTVFGACVVSAFCAKGSSVYIYGPRFRCGFLRGPVRRSRDVFEKSSGKLQGVFGGALRGLPSQERNCSGKIRPTFGTLREFLLASKLLGASKK